MRIEHRQIDIRQHRSMLELIQVHVETAGQIMADMAQRYFLPNSSSRGATRAKNNGMCRGFSALCGAPNWLAAESVSGKLKWMPFAQR